MDIKKLPLAERLNRLDSGLTAHKECIHGLVDSVKTLKLAAYLMDYDGERERLQRLMRFSDKDLNRWSYQDLATYIADRYQSGFSSSKAIAAELMDLLAVPMLTIHRVSKRY